jgi:hypothetical protein
MQYEYTKTAEEFVHLYEKTRRLQQPMDLVGEIWDEVHMNHYRFYAGNRYMDCYASTQNSMIEFGLDLVSEKLPYSERNLTLALALCQDITQGHFAAKVHCYPNYDKGIISFDVRYQSFVPQMPEDLDYMIDGVLILAGIVMDGVDDIIERLKSEQENKPIPPKHYE